MTDGRKLAEAHWGWVNGLLLAQEIDGGASNPRVPESYRYIYLTAFEHGYKHGLEVAEDHLRALAMDTD